MKRFAVFFSFAGCLFFLSATYAPTTFAQAATSSASPDPTPVAYTLSYPGLLPDSPFYFLKEARNHLMEFFLGQPIDKANFTLLESDKHVAASLELVSQKHNVDLAAKTYAVAQDDFGDAITQTISAKKQGMNIEEMVTKLKASNMKHQEVLDQIEQELDERDQAKFAGEKKTEKQLSKQVAALKR